MREVIARTGGTRRDFLAASVAAAAAQFAPTPLWAAAKPECAILVLGHTDHGKTTLTSAITKVQSDRGLGEFAAYAGIDAARVETVMDCTLRIARVPSETDTRRYVHVDCPRHADHVKAMISGAAAVDGAILVVSAADGPMPQSREHIILAAQAGVPAMVVYVNKTDLVDDPELLELVQLEIRELLSKYGFPGDDIHVVRGSALAALEGRDREIGEESIVALMKALDEAIPAPASAADRPFLMAIEDVFSIDGRGTVVTGRVERGVVKVGDALEIVGMRPTEATTCTGLEVAQALVEQAGPGDAVGVVLGAANGALERGQVLAAPASVKPHRAFVAAAYLLTEAEGGRSQPVFSNYQPQLSFRTAELDGRMLLPAGTEMLAPGDYATVEFDVGLPLAIEQKQRFAIREGGRTVGIGIVASIEA